MPPRKEPKTKEQFALEELASRFPSAIIFSVKVQRPTTDYPYETTVWDSEIRVPLDDNIHETEGMIENIVDAWIEMMEAGVKVAGAQMNLKKALKSGKYTNVKG